MGSIYDRKLSGQHSTTDQKFMLESRRRASDTGVQHSVRKNCRIEGDYEVEVSYTEATALYCNQPPVTRMLLRSCSMCLET